ncbi:MAG: hypothetical protein VX127_17055 [Myxococcota bacterium]|nr:hypothetical protein [Myxococcota bacterium]
MIFTTLALWALPLTALAERPSSVGSVDSVVRPIRCHWEQSQHAGLCDEAIDGLEAAWRLQVDGLGWPEPIMDDDGILDVYVSSEGEGGAYAYAPWEDAVLIDGRFGAPAHIVIDPEFDTWFYWTMLHEFAHVLQYSIDVTETRTLAWESTATAMEFWSDPTLLPMDDYIVDFQATPWVGLLGDGWMLWDDHGVDSLYEYGAALWLFHADAMLGGAVGQAGLDLWMEGANPGWENEPDFVDSLDALTGSWSDAWMSFSLARIGVGTADTPGWAASYSDARFAIGVERTVRADELPASVIPDALPYQTGAVYIQLVGLTPGERIRIDINGDPGVRWAAFFHTSGQSDWREDSRVEFTADASRAMVGVVNLGPATFDADDALQTADVAVSLERVDRAVGAEGGVELTGCGCAGLPGSRSVPWVWLATLCIAMRARRDARGLALEVPGG